MQRQIPGLVALAGDPEMRDAAARMPEIPDPELAQRFAPQRMTEQRRQDDAIALLLDGFFRCRSGRIGRANAEQAYMAIAPPSTWISEPVM